jgi:glycosyltransferase involved in cell wall biosynthesis
LVASVLSGGIAELDPAIHLAKKADARVAQTSVGSLLRRLTAIPARDVERASGAPTCAKGRELLPEQTDGEAMMRIGFLDPAKCDCVMDTPLSRPLGGSHSALCYLAVELARLGHAVTVFNGTSSPQRSCEVDVRHWSDLRAADSLKPFDVIVVLNSAMGRDLRQSLAVTAPLVLWTQHADDQPAILELKRLNERKAWSGFAFVSEWQRDCYERAFATRRERSEILRNAVAPAFAAVAACADHGLEPWFKTGEAPTLFYSSTPFRGLDVLLDAFPAIRAMLPEVRLKVYSSMSVYQVRPDEDPHRALYARCQSTDGVDYVGSIGQVALAEALQSTAALAYPSTFAETSCITVLEAMAVGSAVLTTRLGVLPETAAGRAEMIDWLADKTLLAQSFAAMTVAALTAMRKDPDAAEAARIARRQYIRDNYTWPARAKQWSAWLAQIATMPAG